MEFTVVDGGVAAVTLVSGLLAYSRGVTREVFAIGGWIIAALAAFYLAPMLEPLMREAPVIGPFLENCVFSMIAAFTLIVAMSLLILSVFTPLASSLVLGSPLAPVDRALGLVFGVARGLLLLAVAYLLYQQLGGGQPWEPLETAASKPIVTEGARMLSEYVPSQVPEWFSARLDALMAPCGIESAPAGAGLTPNGAVVPGDAATPGGQVAPVTGN